MGKFHCGGDNCELDPYAEERCDCACARCSERPPLDVASHLVEGEQISPAQIAYLRSLVRSLAEARSRLREAMLKHGCDESKLFGVDPGARFLALQHYMAEGIHERVVKEREDVDAAMRLLENAVIETFS